MAQEAPNTYSVLRRTVKWCVDNIHAATSSLAAHIAAADPHTQYQKESEKGAASGYAGLDAGSLVPVGNMGTGAPDGTKFLRDDRTWVTPSSGGAPTTAQYLTLAADGTLTQERVFTVSTGILGVDSGAGAAYTIRFGFAGEADGDIPYRTGGVWTHPALSTLAVPPGRTITCTSPLFIDGGASADFSANRTFSIQVATAAQNGYLSSADWSTFNGKQSTDPGLTSLLAADTAFGLVYPTAANTWTLLAGAGHALEAVRVNAAANALEWFTPLSAGPWAGAGITGPDGYVAGWAGGVPVATERHRPHGWPKTAGAYDFTLSYDPATRVMTLTRTGATMGYWTNGAFVDLGASVSTPAHAATDGLWFFYYTAAGVLTVSMTPWSITSDPSACDISIATVLLDTTTAPDQAIMMDERHTAYRSLPWHVEQHHAIGTLRRPAGAVFSSYTLALDTLAAVQWALSAVTYYDEDLAFTSTAIPAAGPYLVMWRTGATGTWTWDATRTLPWLSDGAGAVAYNAVSGGVWSRIKASSAGGQWMVVWVYALDAYSSSNRIVIIPGQEVYSTLNAAKAATPSSIAFGSMPSQEMVPVGRIVLDCKDSYANITEDAELAEVLRYFPTGGAATLAGSSGFHSSLAGLTWVGGGHVGSNGALPVFSTTGIADEVAPGTSGYPLLGGGAGTPPAYGQVAVVGMYASATARVLGRKTAGAGTVEELTLVLGGDVMPGGGLLDYAHFELQSAGNGGTATSGSWQTYPLATTVSSSGSSVGALTASQWTLAAGTYEVTWWEVGYRVDLLQSQLANVTDAIYYPGISTYSVSTSGTAVCFSYGRATFTIAGTKTFRLEYQVSTTRATNGLGASAGFGTNSFGGAHIRRIA